MLETDGNRTADIEVALDPAHAPTFAAIVSLRREHDTLEIPVAARC